MRIIVSLAPQLSPLLAARVKTLFDQMLDMLL